MQLFFCLQCAVFFVCSVQLFFCLQCAVLFLVCSVYLAFVSSEVYTFNNVGSEVYIQLTMLAVNFILLIAFILFAALSLLGHRSMQQHFEDH